VSNDRERLVIEREMRRIDWRIAAIWAGLLSPWILLVWLLR
jgi:hypothetical protein